MTHEINNKNRQLGAPCRAPKNEGRRWDLRGPSNLRALVETLLDLFFFCFMPSNLVLRPQVGTARVAL